MHRNSRVLEVYVELTDAISLGIFTRELRELDLEIDSIQMEHDNILEDGVRSFIVTLKAKRKRNHELLFQSIRAIEGVAYLEGL